MLEQVGRLIDAARQPHIAIGVLPAGTGAHEGLAGAFALADFDDAPSVGYQEGAVRDWQAFLRLVKDGRLA